MKSLFFSFLLFTVAAGNAQVKKAAANKPASDAATSKPVLRNALDSFCYAAGLSVAESMQQSNVPEMNAQAFAKGLDDAFNKAPALISKDMANTILQKKLAEYANAKNKAQLAENEAYLTLNSKRNGVISLPNGLQYEVIKAGDPAGKKPAAIDTVVVNYVGTLTNGTEFDNSVKRGEAATFALNRVIRGWTEILQLMTKGAHWKVYIPSELAYAAQPPSPQIPPNSVLVFEIILEDIKPANPAPAQ